MSDEWREHVEKMVSPAAERHSALIEDPIWVLLWLEQLHT